jgi:3-hydroxybutyryl-CoA dehydrogenase
MRLADVRRVGVVGGGVMGGGIAQGLALAGYDVIVRDIDDAAIARSREAAFEGKWGMKRAVERGKIAFDDAVAAMERIAFTTSVADLSGVDFLIEAVPEKLELKQEVFAELDSVVKPDAIFTSNTSGFVIQDIARDVSDARQALFAGMHFSNPVPAMRMCEVVVTPQTSPDTVDAVRGVAESMGKVVSMVKDTPETYGFLLNRIFAAARREADRIVADGIASKEDVDKAMITGRNWPAGFYGERGGIGREW